MKRYSLCRALSKREPAGVGGKEAEWAIVSVMETRLTPDRSSQAASVRIVNMPIEEKALRTMLSKTAIGKRLGLLMQRSSQEQEALIALW